MIGQYLPNKNENAIGPENEKFCELSAATFHFISLSKMGNNFLLQGSSTTNYCMVQALPAQTKQTSTRTGLHQLPW